METLRVEKHVIKSDNKYYYILNDFCLKSKNLYNHANYIIRQSFINTNKWIRYQELDLLLKQNNKCLDYRKMPTAQSAQQTLRLLDKNWVSYFKTIKDWKLHPEKYTGRPNLPKYKKTDERMLFILTNQNVIVKGDYLSFPKCFNGFKIKPKFLNRKDYISFRQVRISPHKNYITIELVYQISIPNEILDNKKYASIDIGIDNLATITYNFKKNPLIINGRNLKSINQYYNKELAKAKSELEHINHKKTSKKIIKLNNKRNNKIIDKLHKASRYIINELVSNNVSILVIGYNKGWKQNVELGKQNNQVFTQLPINIFVQQLQYKAQEQGIKVIITEESYTSGTSFLDDEKPIRQFYNKNRRIYRGLFKSNNGLFINADVNGSFQIMKKALPNAYADGIEGVVLHPVKVSLN